jgi:hypothetical protein
MGGGGGGEGFGYAVVKEVGRYGSGGVVHWLGLLGSRGRQQ